MILDVEQIRRDWVNGGRTRFCRGMDPEKFLADIHGYGWTDEMMTALEQETRQRVQSSPDVPIIEHLMDAAIEVSSVPWMDFSAG